MKDKGKEEKYLETQREYLNERGEFDSKFLLTYGRDLVF